MTNEANSYPLGYTNDEARRLAMQAVYLEDLTADVLRRAGVGTGMHVLDLGCGVGDVSLLVARWSARPVRYLELIKRRLCRNSAPAGRNTAQTSDLRWRS